MGLQIQAQLQPHAARPREPEPPARKTDALPRSDGPREQADAVAAWKTRLARDASNACQMGMSRFSLLLHARLAVVTRDIRGGALEQRAKGSLAELLKVQEAADLVAGLDGRSACPKKQAQVQELPAVAAIGLKSFFLTLRSLVKERHELLGEVCRAVCTTLEGLPTLSLVGQDGEILDALEGVLEELVQDHRDVAEGELALQAHFFLALLRGSVANVLNSAWLAARNSTLKLDVRRLVRVLAATKSRPASLSPVDFVPGENGAAAAGPQRRSAPSPTGVSASRADLTSLSEQDYLLRRWPCVLTSGHADGSRELSATGVPGYSTVAADGKFLYVHTSSGLYKLANGYAGMSGAGSLILGVPYRCGERGWLAHAGGALFFRRHHECGEQEQEGPEIIFRLDTETLQEAGHIEVVRYRSGLQGPLLSDGRLLYLVNKAIGTEHFAVEVVAPDAGRHIRSIRLIGPAYQPIEGRKSEGLAPAAGAGAQTQGDAHAGSHDALDCDVFACGQNRKGELGHSATREQLEPALVNSLRRCRVLKVAAGNETSYFLTEEGKVLCCGLNGSGQLARCSRSGVGAESRAIESSASVEPMEGLPASCRIVQVSCFNGAEHVLLLSSTGQVYACGCNTYGQLGVGNTRRSSTPLLIEALEHVQIASVTCSYHHSVAISVDGEAFSFGLNDHGQLGVGSVRNQVSPVSVCMPLGVKVRAASCGQHHTMLLGVDRKLYSCGRNHNGQLGLGTRGPVVFPQLIEALQHEFVTQVAAGYNHTCAVLEGGRLFSFGYNHQGQLGIGSTESAPLPVEVEGLRGQRVVKVSCGAHHTCVLTDVPRVWAFGSNCHGQLGQGDTGERLLPVPVLWLDGKLLADIACGFHHVIALTSDTAVPALDERSLRPAPEGGRFYTDGISLYAHMKPATARKEAPDAAPESSPGAAEGTGNTQRASQASSESPAEGNFVSRGFSLDTGVHIADGRSALDAHHGGVVFDGALGVLWAIASPAAESGEMRSEDGAHATAAVRGSSVGQHRLELYANIGEQASTFLVKGTPLSKFPSIAEVFLSMPEHFVSEEASTRDASSGSLILLAHLEIMCRSSTFPFPLSRASAAAVDAGGDACQDPVPPCRRAMLTVDPAHEASMWIPWCVDPRPETFRVIKEVLSHCVEHLDEPTSLHLALFTLRLLRANIVHLRQALEAGAVQAEGSAPVAKAGLVSDAGAHEGSASVSRQQSVSAQGPSPVAGRPLEEEAAADDGQATAAVLLQCREELSQLRVILRSLLTGKAEVISTIQFECCRILVEGASVFSRDDKDQVDVVLDLLQRYMQDETMCSGEKLLTTMFLEAAAHSNQCAALPIPRPLPPASAANQGDSRAAAQQADGGSVTSDHVAAHVNSLKELLMLLIKMLAPGQSCASTGEAVGARSSPVGARTPVGVRSVGHNGGRMVALAADVCMILLKGLVRSVQEEWEAIRAVSTGSASHEASASQESVGNRLLVQCVCPLFEYIFEVAATGGTKEEVLEASDEQVRSPGPFFSIVLPWVVTACFLLVSDRTFRSRILAPTSRLAASTPLQSLQGAAEAEQESETALHDAVVLESSHPYQASEREIFHVTVPGASFLTIEFDSNSDLASGDYVQVFADDVCKQAVSEKLSLRRSVSTGHSLPMLLVKGSSCSMSFESISANAGQRWGFRCLVSGHTCNGMAPASTPWHSYVTRASLLLSAQIAAALFRESTRPQQTRTGVDEKACKVFARGIRDLPASLCDNAIPASNAAIIEKLRHTGASDSNSTRGMVDRQCDSAVRARLASLVGLRLGSEDEQELAPQVRMRREAVDRAQTVVFATLASAVGYEDLQEMSQDDAKVLWANAAKIQNHVAHEMQRLKSEWMAAGDEDDSSAEQLSQRALDEVLEALRAKAHLVVAFARRTADRGVRLQLPQHAAQMEEVLSFLTAQVEARHVVGEMLARRRIMALQAEAMRGFCAALNSPRADDDLRSDVLRLLSAEMDANSLETTCLSEESLCRELLSQMHALMQQQSDVLRAGSGNRLMLSYAGLLAKVCMRSEPQSAVDFGSAISVLSDICGLKEQAPVLDEVTAANGSFEFITSGEYPAADGAKLVGQYLCRVKVVQVLEKQQATVKMTAAPHLEIREVPLSSLRAIDEPEAARRDVEAARQDVPKPAPGDAVQVYVMPLEAGAAQGEPEGVWFQGVLVQWCGEEAEVELKLEQPKSLKVRVSGDRLRRHAPWQRPPSVTVSRDLCSKAALSVSSAPAHAAKLLDGNLDTYWQSDGSRPHWIQFAFPKPAKVQRVLLFLDYVKDRSFTPKRITVKLGSTPSELAQVSEFHNRQGLEGCWVNVLQSSAAGKECQYLRITIHENHDSGCNSRVRGAKLVASWSEDLGTSESSVKSAVRVAGAAQQVLRLVSSHVLSPHASPSSQDSCVARSHSVATVQLNGLETACMDCLWRNLAAAVGVPAESSASAGLNPTLDGACNLPTIADEKACSEWLEFLKRASGSHVVSSYLCQGGVMRVLLMLVCMGTTPLQLSVLQLLRSLLPRVEYSEGSHGALLQVIFKTTGVALCCKALPVPAGPATSDAPAASPAPKSKPVHWSVGVEGVYLLRALLNSHAWKSVVESCLTSRLESICELETNREGVHDAVAAIAVQGVPVDRLRVGALVGTSVVQDAVLESDEATVVGTVSEYNYDCSMVRIRTLKSPASEFEAHVSHVQVVDAVPFTPCPALVPALAAALEAIDRCWGAMPSREASEGQDADTDTSGGSSNAGSAEWEMSLSQMRLMAVEALSAQVASAEGAGLCVSAIRDGHEPIFYRLVESAGVSQTPAFTCKLPASFDLSRIESALVERTYMCALLGDERIGMRRQESSAEHEVASPSSRQSEEQRLGEEQRLAMAMDLMALGYNLRLCLVALQLNGDDPQAAAPWLLDSSQQYLDSHPELLVQDDLPVERDPSGLPESGEEDKYCHDYLTLRGGGGEGFEPEEFAPQCARTRLRQEHVGVGQILQVREGDEVGGSTQAVEAALVGRCGLVLAIDKEFKSASMRWGILGSYGRPQSVSSIPLRCLCKPDECTVRSLCLAMSLAGDDLYAALTRVRHRMFMVAARKAVARIVAHQPAEDAEAAPLAGDRLAEREHNLCRVVALHECRVGGTTLRVPDAPHKLARLLCGRSKAMAAAGGKSNADSAGEDGLTAAVRAALTQSLVDGLSQSAAKLEDVKRVEESSHPMVGETDSNVKTVTLAGEQGTAVSVMFDVRCHLSGNQKLQLFLDADCTDLVATCSGKGYASFAPIIVPCNSLYIRVTGSSSESCWGYRMLLTPLTLLDVGVLEWSVTCLMRPSLLSAPDCKHLVLSLLNFLTSCRVACPVRIDVARTLVRVLRSCTDLGSKCMASATGVGSGEHGNTHGNTVDDSMVRSAVEEVGAYALGEVRARLSKEEEPGKAHCVMLQVMMEVVAACSVISCGFEPRVSQVQDRVSGQTGGDGEVGQQDGKDAAVFSWVDKTADVKACRDELEHLASFVQERGLKTREVALAPLPSEMPASDEIGILLSLAMDSLTHGKPMPTRVDALLCEAWLAMHHSYAIRESAQHPYQKGTEESGSVAFQGAARLHVMMDARCATDSDDFLVFYRSDPDAAQDVEAAAAQARAPADKVAGFSGPFGAVRGGLDAHPRIVVEGDTLFYTFTGKRASNWGYRFIVWPEYAAKDRAVLLQDDRQLLEQAVAALPACSQQLDTALIHLVNRNHRHLGPGSVACPVCCFLPHKFDLTSLGMAAEDSHALTSASVHAATARQEADPAGCTSHANTLPLALVRFRLSILLVLNSKLLHPMLRLIDLSLAHVPGTLAHTLASWRELVCEDVKYSHLQRVLSMATTAQEKLLVVIDRRAKRPVLEQLQVQLGRVHASRLRHPDMAFLVQFVGEGAEGFNGPYRECLSSVCDELQSARVALLGLCPNGSAGGTAPNQDKFIPRPSADTPDSMAAFQLLGRLLGVALWTSLRLDLHMPPCFWKPLVGQVRALIAVCLSVRLRFFVFL